MDTSATLTDDELTTIARALRHQAYTMKREARYGQPGSKSANRILESISRGETLEQLALRVLNMRRAK